jgi:hypothetical protein
MFAVLSRGRSLSTTAARRPLPSSEALPALEARNLLLRGYGWDGMTVTGLLDLSGSTLTGLPARLSCDSLNLSGCAALEHIGEGLRVRVLDVSGCAQLRELPADIAVSGWCELALSGLAQVQVQLAHRLRWQGLRVSEQAALRPHELSGQQVLETRNLELRRMLLERVGLEKLISDVGGLILNRDRDPGGERKLVRIPFEDAEDIVAVCLMCPSTGGQYAIRVPPWTRTCHEAVAWIAGFEDPDEYQPIDEA